MKQPKTIPALRRRGTRLGRNQRPTKKKMFAGFGNFTCQTYGGKCLNTVFSVRLLGLEATLTHVLKAWARTPSSRTF